MGTAKGSAAPKVVFVGERLFMKFRTLDYFQSRLVEIGARVVSTEGMDDEAIIEAVRDATAIAVIGRPITRAMIEAAPRLRFIMTLSVGYDVVDRAAATERRIPVSNCPVYCSDEVSEHALALVLSLARKLHELIPHVQDGGWKYVQARPIHGLRGRTFGIVGLGRIGRRTAAKAKALGFSVVAFDPYVDDDIFAMLGVDRSYDFDPFLERCDVVSIHAPLTDETYHLFDAPALGRMKANSILVNTARGAIVDRVALEQALQNGTIGGAGIDVLEVEPPAGDEPLLQMPNAIVTPHIAWYSEESHERNMIQGMDEMIRVLSGRRPHHVVNPEVFARR